MTPQELKNSILQMAVQGKLVEQRPEEGTGEELYRQIQEEKQRLIREGKIKKDKPLPEITDEEKPFEIPDGWKWVRLGCITYNLGQKKPDSKFCYIDVGSINNQKHCLSGSETVVEAAAASSRARKIIQYGDVIFATIRPYLQNICIIDRTFSFEPIVSTAFAVMSCLNGLYNKYLFYSLLSPAFMEYANANDKAKGVAYPAIGEKDFYNGLIPLPPLAEQQRIAAKIEELLPLLDRYEKAWSKLEAFNKRFPVDMQKSLLQMAIQGKLVEQKPEEGTGEELYRQIQEEKKRLIREGKIKKDKPLPEITDEEKPFEIPESWKWCRINTVTVLNPKNKLPDDMETAFIPMSYVSDGFKDRHSFDVKKWKEIKKGFSHFADGDIGVAKITPCFQNRKSVVFKNLKNGYGAGTTELSIVRTVNKMVYPKYLLWFFKTDYFISNGVKSFTGTAGQQRIHKDYLASCLLPLPPLAEQQRIVAKLEELLPLCEKLKQGGAAAKTV